MQVEEIVILFDLRSVDLSTSALAGLQLAPHIEHVKFCHVLSKCFWPAAQTKHLTTCHAISTS